MADLPVVSVIVPVHNAAAYLGRCLDSIAAQTLGGIETVLVDDGSTDGSTALCEAFAARRAHAVVVRHDSARGVSAARNAGVAASSGRYIGFVDSDDWAAPTLFETLVRAAESTESDVAQVQYLMCSKPQAIENGPETIQVLSPDEALAAMLLKEEYAVWNRLYRRSLFDGCAPDCFPEGLTCEDRVGNFKLLAKANRVAVSSRTEYFYYQNLGSISFNGLDSRGFDLLEADRLMVESARGLGNEKVLGLAQDRAAKSSFSLLVKWVRFGVTDPSLDERAALDRLFGDFKENYRRLMKSPLSRAKKVAAWQLMHCPSLLKLEFGMLNRMKGIDRQGAGS